MPRFISLPRISLARHGLAVAAFGLATSVVLVACGASHGSTATPTPGLSGCPSTDAKAAVDVLDPSVQEFGDELDRASSTSRIALSPVVGEMQKSRRDLDRADVPSCALEIKSAIIASEDDIIQGFLGFMADEPDSEVSQHLQDGTDHLDGVRDELTKLRIDALLSSGSPTPSP